MSLSYHQQDSDPDSLRPFFIYGFFFAVLLHIGLIFWLRQSPIESFGASYYDKIIPRTFQVEPVEIDPKYFDQADAIVEETPAKPMPDETKIQIPEEKPTFDLLSQDLIATPSAPEESTPLVESRPQVIPSDLSLAAEEIRQDQQRSLEEDLNSLTQQLLTDRPVVNSRPLIEIPGLDPTQREMIGLATNLQTEMRGENQGPTAPQPGYSDLDSLLSQAGPLRNSTAPILMPTDLLFDYDDYRLRTSAVDSMAKLGQIIRRNPGATFIIEGHSDGIGSADYNLRLSQLRAESVKVWLVQAMGIDPGQIQTRGLGMSRLIVPGHLGVDEQQINRRVEIVIRNAAGS